MCINWHHVFLVIFLANFCQLIFEASMLYSLEVTFSATPLEKYQNRYSGLGMSVCVCVCVCVGTIRPRRQQS